ncbi:MAG: hypothetical protein II611_03185, partial [Treponema sp.]|nr:hypothetical protein [Treponema sp.]
RAPPVPAALLFAAILFFTFRHRKSLFHHFLHFNRKLFVKKFSYIFAHKIAQTYLLREAGLENLGENFSRKQKSVITQFNHG